MRRNKKDTTVKNCYNIGKIIGNSKIGGIIGTVTPYETAEGHEYVYNCYSNLQKENGTNKWTIDTTGIKNSGYPYLIENKPE